METNRAAGLLLLSFLAVGVVCAVAQPAAQPNAAPTMQSADANELEELKKALQNSTDSSVEVAAALWKKAIKHGKCIVGKKLVDCTSGEYIEYQAPRWAACSQQHITQVWMHAAKSTLCKMALYAVHQKPAEDASVYCSSSSSSLTA